MLIPRVLIFVTRGTRVLLLRGSPTKRLWANRYNGLGGHVEPGEDILSAAKRELLEEAGLTLEPPALRAGSQENGEKGESSGLWLCGTILVDTRENPGIGLFVFTGECTTGEPRDSAEGTLHWVEFDEVQNLPGVEDLPVLLGHLQGMKRGDPPFSGRSFYTDEGKQVVEIHR